jgi:DNA-directed RNA polymerase specialized sigma24 family protein
VLEAHRDAVGRFLVANVGRDDAEDCLQETLLSALRGYPALRPGSNVRAWLFAIARNKAIDSHRARARQPLPVGDGAGGGVALDADGPDEELWEAVRDLPPKQRAAVTLRFASDLSHRDIAVVLDCSEAAARRSLHEGLNKLREVWT